MTKPILKITPPLEPYGDCIADAVLAAAVHLGSDGRGRGGLRGYMISLGREHPEALLKLLNKVLKAELANKPTSATKTPSEKNDMAIVEAIRGAARALGRDGRGRHGMSGYLMSLMSRKPEIIVKLLRTILNAEAAELKAQSKPTIQERMSKRSEMGVETVYGSVMDALDRFGEPKPKRAEPKQFVKNRMVYRSPVAVQSSGGSSIRWRTAISRLAAARRS